MSLDHTREARALLEEWSAGALPPPAVLVDLPSRPARGAVRHAADGARWLACTAALEPEGVGSGALDARAAARTLVDTLRGLSSFANLERAGIDLGFRVEELFAVRASARTTDDAEALGAYLRRVAGASLALELRVDPALAERAKIDGAFRERTDGARAAHTRYGRWPDGRVRVEAFELHVVEHCNLRCAHCCNMSPYLDERFVPAAEVLSQARELAKSLRADVFKIMGGEPLLHPEITEIVAGLRETGIGEVIRLFTNGLLLHKMPEAFWRSLDQLTVSNYSSGPVKPAHLAWVREQCDAHDVVLNVKSVDRFSLVMNPAREESEGAIKAVYDDCWLRHRCLIVRDGRFSKCTRAAYFREYQSRLQVPSPDPDPAATWERDTIPVEGEDFAGRLLAYLNDPTPLGACTYCHGSSGPVVPHTQLTKRSVREGRFSNE